MFLLLIGLSLLRLEPVMKSLNPALICVKRVNILRLMDPAANCVNAL